MTSKSPRSQSDCTAEGCVGQTSLLHKSLRSQHTRLKESAANFKVPDIFRSLLEFMPQFVRAVSVAQGMADGFNVMAHQCTHLT